MDPVANEHSSSTLSEWEYRKVMRRPAGPTGQRGEATPLKRLALRNRRKPLTVTITYRGGPESWWELRARGKVVRVPGHRFVEDALSQFDGTLRK